MLHQRDWPSIVYQDELSCNHYLPIFVLDDDSRVYEQCVVHEACLKKKYGHIYYTYKDIINNSNYINMTAHNNKKHCGVDSSCNCQIISTSKSGYLEIVLNN